MLYFEIRNATTNAFMSVAQNKRDIDFYDFKVSLYILFRIDDTETIGFQNQGQTQRKVDRACGVNTDVSEK